MTKGHRTKGPVFGVRTPGIDDLPRREREGIGRVAATVRENAHVPVTRWEMGDRRWEMGDARVRGGGARKEGAERARLDWNTQGPVNQGRAGTKPGHSTPQRERRGKDCGKEIGEGEDEGRPCEARIYVGCSRRPARNPCRVIKPQGRSRMAKAVPCPDGQLGGAAVGPRGRAPWPRRGCPRARLRISSLSRAARRSGARPAAPMPLRARLASGTAPQCRVPATGPHQAPSPAPVTAPARTIPDCSGSGASGTSVLASRPRPSVERAVGSGPVPFSVHVPMIALRLATHLPAQY